MKELSKLSFEQLLEQQSLIASEIIKRKREHTYIIKEYDSAYDSEYDVDYPLTHKPKIERKVSYEYFKQRLEGTTPIQSLEWFEAEYSTTDKEFVNNKEVTII